MRKLWRWVGASLAVGLVDRAGFDLAAGDVAAAGGGDSFPNTGVEFLFFRNGDVSPKTVTFITQVAIDGQAVGDRAVVVPANSEMLIGPFPPEIYNNTSGEVAMTYSAVTSCFVKPLKVFGLRL